MHLIKIGKRKQKKEKKNQKRGLGILAKFC
jgi:hypothetical protein